MTSLIILGLVAVLLLQAMRMLSGTHIVLAGVLSLALLWPVTRWVITSGALHQAAHGKHQKALGSSHPDGQQPSLVCRLWKQVDRHEKGGRIRDQIRQSCEKEF
jgi:hypothetical protein